MKKLLKAVFVILIAAALIAAAVIVIRHTGDRISPLQAKDIALQASRLNESDIADSEIELKNSLFSVYYDVELDNGCAEYHIRLDARTGKVISLYSHPSER